MTEPVAGTIAMVAMCKAENVTITIGGESKQVIDIIIPTFTADGSIHQSPRYRMKPSDVPTLIRYLQEAVDLAQKAESPRSDGTGLH